MRIDYASPMRGLSGGGKPRTVGRRLALIMAGTALAATSIGCAYRGLSMPMPSASNPRPAHTVSLFGSGTLTTPSATSKAITYNPGLAPVGAALTAALIPSSDGSTTAELTVSGLLPNRGYAVHAHTKACGATGAAAGPHFQNHEDPAATPQAPSTNPEYANPRNEIWLDVRTDTAGAGTSRTTVPFVLTDRVPGSIIVHEAMQTATGPGEAGQAGARIACLTLSGQ
jgi:Cu-Zn family superoxide dismutase